METIKEMIEDGMSPSLILERVICEASEKEEYSKLMSDFLDKAFEGEMVRSVANKFISLLGKNKEDFLSKKWSPKAKKELMDLVFEGHPKFFKETKFWIEKTNKKVKDFLKNNPDKVIGSGKEFYDTLLKVTGMSDKIDGLSAPGAANAKKKLIDATAILKNKTYKDAILALKANTGFLENPLFNFINIFHPSLIKEIKSITRDIESKWDASLSKKK